MWLHGDMELDGVEIVRRYLRAGNLEQIGRVDEAVELYELAVEHRFDAAGPYDRLIAIYSARSAHREVVRVAEAALANVRTHEDKREWYRKQRSEALKAQGRLPRPVPRSRA